jgi:threonine synthase
MTSVLDANVFNLAVEGSFDDCQLIMKTLFSDLPFKDAHALGTVNSVNWARVLSQIVYYFYAAFRVRRKPAPPAVQFAVPTGNFGDILAGWYAKQMGLPIRRLSSPPTKTTSSPASSTPASTPRARSSPPSTPPWTSRSPATSSAGSTTRSARTPRPVARLMTQFALEGRMEIPRDAKGHVDLEIVAGASDTPHTLAAIKHIHAKYGYLLDPHTAAGVFVAGQFNELDDPMICLATAHPAKFPDAIEDATGEDLAHHPMLDALEKAPTRCEVIANSPAAVKTYLAAAVKTYLAARAPTTWIER